MKKIVAFFAALILLCLCGCQKETPPTPSASPDPTVPSIQQEGTEEISMENNAFYVRPDTVRFLGRHHLNVQNIAYGFYNVAAGIVFDCETTSLELQLSASAYGEHNLNYVAVYIDDREPISICVSGMGWYTVAEDLEPGVRHTVRVVKRTMTNAGAVYVHQVRLSEGGRAWINADVRPHRIQVLGDSITCGYGTLWDGSDSEDVTVYQAGDRSYAVTAAQLLNAELEVIAISGIGVGNAVNEPYPLLPNYQQEDMHNGIDCDFTKYVPEVVVIALGTNDVGHGNPIDVFANNAENMIRFIRQQYPDCIIVWTYGAMGAPSYGEGIRQMIEDLTAGGMKDLYYLPFTPSADEPMGQHGHPGQQAHDRMGLELAQFISQITGWTLQE